MIEKPIIIKDLKEKRKEKKQINQLKQENEQIKQENEQIRNIIQRTNKKILLIIKIHE